MFSNSGGLCYCQQRIEVPTFVAKVCHKEKGCNKVKIV